MQGSALGFPPSQPCLWKNLRVALKNENCCYYSNRAEGLGTRKAAGISWEPSPPPHMGSARGPSHTDIEAERGQRLKPTGPGFSFIARLQMRHVPPVRDRAGIWSWLTMIPGRCSPLPRAPRGSVADGHRQLPQQLGVYYRGCEAP